MDKFKYLGLFLFVGILMINFYSSHNHTRVQFNLDLKNEVCDIEYSMHEFAKLKLCNDVEYYLGGYSYIFNDYIQVGDSVIKPKNTRIVKTIRIIEGSKEVKVWEPL